MADETVHLGELASESGEPAAPEPAAPEPAPSPRRRWPRVVLTIGIVLVAIVLLVVIAWQFVGDRLLREHVEDRIRAEILTLDAVPDDAPVEVEVAGGPMLPQLLNGALDRVQIDVGEFAAGSLSGSAIINATGVPLRPEGTVESISASIQLPVSAVEERIRDSLGVAVDDVEFLSGTLVRLSTTLRAFGLAVPASVTVELSALDGDSIGLRPTDVALGEQHIDPADVLDVPIIGPIAAPLLAPSAFCVADLLPAGFSLDRLIASPGTTSEATIEISVSARDLALSDAALSATGTC